MKEWLFKFMMKLLLIICIIGLIVKLIWELTFILCIIIILSPFALIIYFKIIRSIKEASV